MVNPNWSLLYANGPQGGFQNALERGFAIGTDMRQRRETTERRNALSDYLLASGGTRGSGGSGIVATPEQRAETAALEAAFPNAPRYGETEGMDEARERLARLDPETYMQVREYERADAERRRMQEQQRRQQSIEGLTQFRPLLERAIQSPEMWERAYLAAQQAGADMSRIPREYSPQWAKGQIMILDAVEDGSISGIMRDLQTSQTFREGTPETQEEMVLWALQGRYGSEYVDEQGNTRRRSAPIPQPQPRPQPQQQQAPVFTVGQWEANQRGLGDAFLPWIERNRPVVVNSQGQQVQTDVIDGQVAYNVNGTWYDNPEGN